MVTTQPTSKGTDRHQALACVTLVKALRPYDPAAISHIGRGLAPKLANPSIVMAAIGFSIAVSFQMLLPVVPVLLERDGPPGAAGAATAALFVGAVVGELCTPWLMSRRSSSSLLITSQLLTAAASLVYVVPHPTAWQMLAAAAARGSGMGIAIVVAVVLVARLGAPNRRGTAIGYFGLALTLPGIAIPSIGVSLVENGRTDVAALVAFFSCLSGAFLTLQLPRRTLARAGVVTGLFAALRRSDLVVLVVGFVVISCSFGAVITYVPIALPRDGFGSAAVFLLVLGASRSVSRWLAGVVGDHQPVRAVLIGGVGLSLVGVIVLAVGSGPLSILIAGVCYGTGYGAVQTGAYLAMMARSTSSYSGAISALYNGAIDLGGALGGALIGLSAARYGYAGAVWAMPAMALLALPLLWRRVKPEVSGNVSST